MFRSVKICTLLLSIFFCSRILFAQNSNNWIDLWQTPGTNFFVVKAAFDSAYYDREQEMIRDMREHPRDSHGNEELDGTYFQFKRWEYFMQPRVGETGDVSIVNTTNQKFNEYLQGNPAAMTMHNSSVARMQSSSSWSFVGPTGAPTNSGAGRLCCIRFDPVTTTTMYVGTPAGGLWKSTNSGTTWTCLTDFLPEIGCSDVAIDPTNTNIIYMASGDNDAGDSPSIGVMKSTDGGLSWNTTGLSFTSSQVRRIGRLLIDPSNPNILYAGTSSGIYKTYDAGVNWYLVSQLNTQDMEFKPGDPNTIYACKTSFFKSTNGGLTWSLITTGLPQSSIVARLAIAVTPAAPDNVYVVAAHTSSYISEGVYLSTNSGSSFTPQSGQPNLLGWDPSGGDNTGQGWYDLSIAVAPYDANIVLVGGVNVWRSDDAGVNWTLNAHWTGSGAPYVHADVHDIVFDPVAGGSYYIGCDGGIFKTVNDGGSFSDLSHNLSIAQIYSLGLSQLNSGTLITGHQDNGTNVKVGANYFEGLGGDGMVCFIDRTNDGNMFGELYYGAFNRSTNGGGFWSGITSGLTGSADWVTPWCQDPVNANTLYAGYDQLFKSTDLGNTWNPTSTTMLGVLKDIEIAPSNNQIIYTTTGVGVTRSSDGGVTWANITPSVNTSSSSITKIAVSSYDPNKIWISLSGYTPNMKCFYSADGGTTWTNISYGLPNLPANCITSVPGSMSDAIFIGCDVGVYYRDNSSANWQPFFQSLPDAPVYDLKIFKPTMILRAATYGRGVWEVPIDQSLLVPQPNFTANLRNVCPGQSISFTDLSTMNPVSWQWSFPGGNPSSSTVQNPSIVYNTPGTYPVTLVATNAAGNATLTQTAYITVNGNVQPPFVEGFLNSTFVPAGWTTLNGGNQNFFWQRSNTVGHNSTNSAYFNNYTQNGGGDKDDIRTMGLDFTGYSSLQLQFDVAYARYSNSRSDSLEVRVSTDCGVTWTTVYVKGGLTLATAGTLSTPFTPSNNQWRTETVNLGAYANQSDVIFAFRNHARHGNYLYVDNINIAGTANAAPVASFSMNGNVCENNAVTFNDLSSPVPASWMWYFPGGNPSTSTSQNATTIFATAGTYTVSLVSTNSFGSDSVSQVITVNSSPAINAGADSSYCSGTYVQLNASGGTTYSWSPSTGMSNPNVADPGIYLTASGTFVVLGYNPLGCYSSDTVAITIKPNPAFSVNAAPSIICVGDTSLLTVTNPAWSYAWTPTNTLNIATGDSVVGSPTQTTNYTVIATDTNGCTATGIKTVTVTPPLMTPSVLVNGFQLTCSVFGYSYQWYLNGNPIAGATSQTYTATQVGNYSVEAFTYQGCSSGISSQLFVNGIEDHSSMPIFSVAPNPNSGEFDLSFVATENADYVLQIFSIDGKLVFNDELKKFSGSYTKHIDIRSYGAGSYVVRLTNEKQQTVQRVIVF
ncbi:MAG: PKD domain-containing protein [Bacteroidetes bacterium]|nr:PKD domain-containing protein [Bacteroidota bacterium]